MTFNVLYAELVSFLYDYSILPFIAVHLDESVGTLEL